MDNRRRAPSAVSWSELPPEILSAIGKRLEWGIDVFRFRSVCRNWRLSLNPNPNILSSFLPLKISNPTLPFCARPDDSVVLIARTVLLVKPLDQQSEWILTVEEFNPGKVRILYPLSKDRMTNIPSNFPKCLIVLEFNVSEISRGYGFRYSSDESDVSGVDKVVLCSDSCTAMVLYGKGTLVGVRLKNGNWGYVRQSLVSAFSDVITFKEMFYAIDYEGNVYVVDHKMMKVIKTVAVKCSVSSSYIVIGRMYLVESKGDLYSALGYVDHLGARVVFRLYSPDEKEDPWVDITSPNCAAFFFSCYSCFSLDVIHGYECAICSGHRLHSSAGSTPTKNKLFGAASEDLQVGIYPTNPSGKIDNYATKFFASMLWPPPAWFWPDTYSASEDEQEKEDGVVLPVSFEVENCTPRLDIPSASTNIVEQAHVSSFDRSASAMNLEGLNIKPNLMPTLQKLWARHGNLMEGCPLQNREMVSKALESLAKVVLILMRNTGQSLSEPQAVYLRSAVSDLQQMNFKVAWLIPFVERALAVYKSRPLVGSLKDFAKAKAQADEMKLKVLDELLDEVEEDLALVLEKIPALEEVDLNKCLGEGLY